MIKNLHAHKCVTIINDDLHSWIFDQQWFQNFKAFISFITIFVEEYDDLLSPQDEIQEALAMANEVGCQMYIILLANGLQCTRFLRFGERYRMLDTRVKFILLYDSRLFDKDLYYLWKRIVNVVFIREYEGLYKDVGKKNNPWFELITVPFPSPINAVLVPKRLDIYSRGKFRKGTDLFREKTIDLKNQTLKIVTFSHTPGTRKNLVNFDSSNLTNDDYDFFGAEVEILKTVSKAMNFRYEIYEPENADIELWGRKGIETKYSGIIGEMVYTHADIALGDLYYIPPILNLMDLSIPYNTECLTFVTPEALTDNSWKTLILPFSSFMWLGVLLCLALSAVSFYWISRFHCNVKYLKEKHYKEQTESIHVKKKRVITLTMFPEVKHMDDDTKYIKMKEQYSKPVEEGQHIGLYLFSEPFNCLLYTYSMLLLVSLPKLPSGWSLRILTGWYWLYSLLVVVAYRSSLTAILARPVPRVTIDTLQELIESKLATGGWGEINREFFQTALDPTIHEIGKTFEIVNSSEEAIDRVADGKFAFYENTYFLKEAIVKRQVRFQANRLQSNSTKNTKTKNNIVREDRSLHIMDDCVINMPVSIGLQKNSPIKPRFDKHIRTVLEAGLIKKWLDDAMQQILNVEVQTVEETMAIMSMRKFSGALVVLIIGYVLSLLIFTSELLYFNFVFKRNPNYNKYSRSIVKKSE
ncbi:glutamate receptor 1-like [Harmonia axyridis]|uniref:glutamate receptor 1-like n=1 Tax=Harmonia axyridis TaxID=115357 RepID=UPI001E2750B9|nr:glutamate receptor 1-like [Harmonia axyridis]